jgi:hypothetical protein
VGGCGIVVLLVVVCVRVSRFDYGYPRRELPEAKSPGEPPINEETEKRIVLLSAPEDREVVRTLLRDK